MRLYFVFILLFWCSATHAMDRSRVVRERIQSTLSSILAPNEFMVLVNRAEGGGDGAELSSERGAVRSLPGLGVGVDSRGEVVPQGASVTSYYGPVIARVIIDDKVPGKTFDLIKGLMGEISGGGNDADEISISRGALKVPSERTASSPQISIQNSPPVKDDFRDNVKFVFLFIVIAGALFLLLTRALGAAGPGNDNRKASEPSALRAAEASAAATESGFSFIDPLSMSLVLNLFLKKKEFLKIALWKKAASPSVQRATFARMPAWVLSYLDAQKSLRGDDAKEAEEGDLAELLSECVRIEQSLKTESQRFRAFLQWFPAEALRFVPVQRRKEFTDASKRTLWGLRSDLGSFTEVRHDLITENLEEPRLEELKLCVEELTALPSSEFERSLNGGSMLERWASAINSLMGFSPIDAQLEQARRKLNESQFSELQRSVVHIKSPLDFTADERKEWLRFIEPDDFIWWKKSAKVDPQWDLSQELRPLKRAAFQQAAEEMSCQRWSESEKKAASERLLRSMRTIRFKEPVDDQAA